MTEVNMEKIGMRIKDIRLSKSLTQQTFADLIGSKRNNIAQVEAGNTIPTSHMIASVIVKGSISPAYLFYGVGPIHNEKWNSMLDDALHEKEILSKTKTENELELYQMLFDTKDEAVLDVFKDTILNSKDDIKVGSSKEILLLSVQSAEKIEQFVSKTFDEDEAYFVLKNAVKIFSIARGTI